MSIERCRRCGRPVYLESNGKWYHTEAVDMFSRGCRSASFHPDIGWDETLDRRWMATGPRKTQTPPPPMTITPAFADKIWTVLVTTCGAAEGERAKFVRDLLARTRQSRTGYLKVSAPGLGTYGLLRWNTAPKTPAYPHLAVDCDNAYGRSDAYATITDANRLLARLVGDEIG